MINLEKRRVHVNPVTADVDGHRDLEQDCRRRIEDAEGGEETHGGATVREHVKHGAKLRRLVEKSGSMSVHSVEKSTQLQPQNCNFSKWVAMQLIKIHQ